MKIENLKPNTRKVPDADKLAMGFEKSDEVFEAFDPETFKITLAGDTSEISGGAMLEGEFSGSFERAFISDELHERLVNTRPRIEIRWQIEDTPEGRREAAAAITKLLTGEAT